MKWQTTSEPAFKKLSHLILATLVLLCLSILSSKQIYAQGMKNSFVGVGDWPVVVVIVAVILIGCVWRVWGRRKKARRHILARMDTRDLDWIRAGKGRG